MALYPIGNEWGGNKGILSIRVSTSKWYERKMTMIFKLLLLFQLKAGRFW